MNEFDHFDAQVDASHAGTIELGHGSLGFTSLHSQSTSAIAPGQNGAIGTPATPSGQGTPVMDETKLFVGNLPPTITESELRGLFTRFGKLEEVVLLQRSSVSGCRCAFVRFKDQTSAVEAINEVHGKVAFPRHASFTIVVRIADPPKTGGGPNPQALLARRAANANVPMDAVQPYATPTGSSAPHVDDEVKLFVGNLPPDMTQHSLSALFAPYGNLLEAFIFRRGSTTTGAKCAFVRFASQESADEAVNYLNGLPYYGRPLIVRAATEKRKSPVPHQNGNGPVGQHGMGGGMDMRGAPPGHGGGISNTLNSSGMRLQSPYEVNPRGLHGHGGPQLHQQHGHPGHVSHQSPHQSHPSTPVSSPSVLHSRDLHAPAIPAYGGRGGHGGHGQSQSHHQHQHLSSHAPIGLGHGPHHGQHHNSGLHGHLGGHMHNPHALQHPGHSHHADTSYDHDDYEPNSFGRSSGMSMGHGGRAGGIMDSASAEAELGYPHAPYGRSHGHPGYNQQQGHLNEYSNPQSSSAFTPQSLLQQSLQPTNSSNSQPQTRDPYSSDIVSDWAPHNSHGNDSLSGLGDSSRDNDWKLTLQAALEQLTKNTADQTFGSNSIGGGNVMSSGLMDLPHHQGHGAFGHPGAPGTRSGFSGGRGNMGRGGGLSGNSAPPVQGMYRGRGVPGGRGSGAWGGRGGGRGGMQFGEEWPGNELDQHGI